MAIEVILPKVDMDMETGTITEWKVVAGDRVRQGQILFDIETNKALMEVESPASGVIRDLAAITGSPLAVGTTVAWIDEDSAGKTAATASVGDAVARTEKAGAKAVAKATAAADAAAPSGAPASTQATASRATPFARRAARMLDVDLADVVGSGPAGRIVERDVAAMSAAAAASKLAAGSDRLLPFNPVRRIVAQRIAESARTAPHFFLTTSIDMAALQAALQRFAENTAAGGARPSLTVALAHIAARVLLAHPLLNASIEGDAVRLHTRVNIGIAVDQDGDLYVPVLRDVATRTLRGLAAELARLRDAVRARTIAPDELRGGTFTISNLGMYGVDAFTAIINPPESAILAVGRTIDTPVARDGQVVVRPMATFSLSSDHRIVDGVTAARFAADFRAAIEHPELA